MARPFVPRGPSIGRAVKPQREIRAEEKLREALDARGFTFDRFLPVKGGVVAIAIGDGSATLAHIGRDKVDAQYNLARLAAAPVGRA